MKTFKKTLITLIILVGNITFLQAQDTIVKRDNERIVCKIKEISTDEIKYLLLNNGNEILLGIDKNDVSKVILSNGTVMNFSNSMYGPENYKGQKKNCIKVQIFTPLLYDYTAITYERSLKPGNSIEATVGIIGLGDNELLGNSSGLSLKLGYKFISTPDFYTKGIRNDHILKGFYLRPEIAFSSYNRNDQNYFLKPENAKNYFSMALLFNVGKQWIFNNIIALDIFFGAGFGYSSDDEFGIRYGFTTGANGFPIAVTSGFRLGILF
jgi:hypothetical protein